MIESFKDGIADPLLLLDDMFDALHAYFPFTRDRTRSLSFTLAIRGGSYGGHDYADTVFTLGASTTTYVEADTTAHTIVSNTTGYTGGTKVAIGIAVTNGEGLTSWQQDFTTGGAGGGSAGPTGPGYKATSTTSLALASSGSASFTTQAGLAYAAGMRVRAVATAATNTYEEGIVSSYSGTTLVVALDRSVGTAGTYTAWNLGIAGDRGATGATGGGGGGGSSPLTTKGDLWGFDTADDRLPVGSNGQVLTADSGEPLGVKWAASSGGGGSSAPTVVFDFEFTGANGTTTFSDAGPQSIVANAVGGAQIQSNKLSLTSVGDYLSVEHRGRGNLRANDFTLSLKFATSQTQQYTTLVAKDGVLSDGSAGSMILLLNTATNDGKIALYTGDLGAVLTTSSGGFNDGAEHTVVIRRIGSTVELIVDGASLATFATRQPIFEAASPFTFGYQSYNPTTRQFIGTMDAIVLTFQ